MTNIVCPYCKQVISDTDTVCPYCTTNLVKNDYSKYLMPVGAALFVLWIAANIAGFVFLQNHLQVLTLKDKNNCLIFSLAEYIQLLIQPSIVVCAPYVIALIKKYQIKISIACISMCIILLMLFISYFIHLQKLAGI